MSLNNHNLLNINTNANVKNTTKGNKTIGSPDLKIGTTGHALIAKVFKLNDSTNCNENLAKALMGIVVEAGCSIVLNNTSDAGTILEDVGQYIFDKQASASKALSQEDVTMLQNVSIVLKVARKINNDKPGTFNCFTEFNRHSRYSYKDDGDNPQVDATAGRKGQDATSWTSFFKDALAFDAKQKGKTNVGEIFKGGTPINDLNKHNELLKQFNPNESDYQSELNQFWRSSGGSGHDPASSVGSSTHVATNGTTTNTAGAPSSTPEEVRLNRRGRSFSDEDSRTSGDSLNTLKSRNSVLFQDQASRLSGNTGVNEARIRELTAKFQEQLHEAFDEVKQKTDSSLQQIEQSATANQSELQVQHQQGVAAFSDQFQKKLDELKINYEERLAGVYEASSQQIERLNAQVKQFSDADQIQMEHIESIRAELKAAYDEALQKIEESNAAALSRLQQIIGVQNDKIRQQEQKVRSQGAALDGQSKIIKTQGELLTTQTQVLLTQSQTIGELQSNIQGLSDYCRRLLFGLVAQHQVISLGAGMVFAQRNRIQELSTQLAEQKADIDGITYFLQNLPRDFNRFNQQNGVVGNINILVSGSQIEEGGDVPSEIQTPLGGSQNSPAQTSVVGDGTGQEYLVPNRAILQFVAQFRGIPEGVLSRMGISQQGTFRQLVTAAAGNTFNPQALATSLGRGHSSSAGRQNLQQMMFFLVLSLGIKKGVISPKTMQQLGITAEPQRHGPLAVVASISQKAQQLNLLQQGERGVFISDATSFTPLDLYQLKMAMGTLTNPMSLRLPSGGGITVYPYRGREQQRPYIEVFTIWKESLPEQTKSLLGLNIRESEILPRLQPAPILKMLPFLLTENQNEGLLNVWPEQRYISLQQDSHSQLGLISSVEGKYVLNSTVKAVLQHLFLQGDISSITKSLQSVTNSLAAINSGEVHLTELQSDVGNLLQMIVAASGGGSLTKTATGGQIVFNPKMVGIALAILALLLTSSLQTEGLQVLTLLDIGNGQQLFLNCFKGSIGIGLIQNLKPIMVAALPNHAAQRAIEHIVLASNQGNVLTGTGNLQLTGQNDGSRSSQSIYGSTFHGPSFQDFSPRGLILGGGGIGSFDSVLSNTQLRVAISKAIGIPATVFTPEGVTDLLQNPSAASQATNLPQPPSRTLGGLNPHSSALPLRPPSTSLNTLGYGSGGSNEFASIRPPRKVDPLFQGLLRNPSIRMSGVSVPRSLNSNSNVMPPPPPSTGEDDGSASNTNEARRSASAQPLVHKDDLATTSQAQSPAEANIQSVFRQFQQNRLESSGVEAVSSSRILAVSQSTGMPVGSILVSSDSEMTSITRANEMIITDSGMPNNIIITFNGRSVCLDLNKTATYLHLDGPDNVRMFLDGLKDLVGLGGKNIKGFLTSFKSLMMDGQLNLLDEGTNASLVSKGVINDRLNFVVELLSAFGMLPGVLLSAFGMLPGVDNQRELESWFQSIMMSEDGEAQPAYFNYPLVKFDAGNSFPNLFFIGANIGGVFSRLPHTYLSRIQPILRGVLRRGTGFSNPIFDQVPRVRLGLPNEPNLSGVTSYLAVGPQQPLSTTFDSSQLPPPPPSTSLNTLGYGSGESNEFASIRPPRKVDPLFQGLLRNPSIRMSGVSVPRSLNSNSNVMPPQPPSTGVEYGSASNTNEARRSASAQPVVHKDDLATTSQAQSPTEATTATEYPSLGGLMKELLDCIKKHKRRADYLDLLDQFLAEKPSNEHLKNLGSVSKNLINEGDYDSFVSIFQHVSSLPNSPELQSGRDDFYKEVAGFLFLTQAQNHIEHLNNVGIQFKLSMFKHLFEFYKRQDISDNVNSYENFNSLLENGVIPDDICFDGDKYSLMATSIKHQSSSLLKTLFELPENIDLEYKVIDSGAEEVGVVVNQPNNSFYEPQSYAVEFHEKTPVSGMGILSDTLTATYNEGISSGIKKFTEEAYTRQRDSLKATLSFDERRKVYTLSIPNTLDRDSRDSSITFKTLPIDILKELINGQPNMVNIALAILNSPESVDILDLANLGALFGGLNQTDVALLKGSIPDSEINLTQLDELISKIYRDQTQEVSVSVTDASFPDQDIIEHLNEHSSSEAANTLECVSSLLKMKYRAIITQVDNLLEAAEHLKEDDKAKILTRLGIQQPSDRSFNEQVKQLLNNLIEKNQFKDVDETLTEIRNALNALKASEAVQIQKKSEENLTKLFSNKAANDVRFERQQKKVATTNDRPKEMQSHSVNHELQALLARLSASFKPAGGIKKSIQSNPTSASLQIYLDHLKPFKSGRSNEQAKIVGKLPGDVLIGELTSNLEAMLKKLPFCPDPLTEDMTLNNVLSAIREHVEGLLMAENDANQSRGSENVSGFDTPYDEDPYGDGSSSSGGTNQFGGNSFGPVGPQNTGSGSLGASIGSGSHAGAGTTGKQVSTGQEGQDLDPGSLTFDEEAFAGSKSSMTSPNFTADGVRHQEELRPDTLDPEDIAYFFKELQINLDQDLDPESPILDSVVDTDLASHINELMKSHNVEIEYEVGKTTVKACIGLIKHQKEISDSEINRPVDDFEREFEQFNMDLEDKVLPELGSSGRFDPQIDMAFEIIYLKPGTVSIEGGDRVITKANDNAIFDALETFMEECGVNVELEDNKTINDHLKMIADAVIIKNIKGLEAIDLNPEDENQFQIESGDRVITRANNEAVFNALEQLIKKHDVDLTLEDSQTINDYLKEIEGEIEIDLSRKKISKSQQLNSAALDISTNSSSTDSIHHEVGDRPFTDPTSLNDVVPTNLGIKSSGVEAVSSSIILAGSQPIEMPVGAMVVSDSETFSITRPDQFVISNNDLNDYLTITFNEISLYFDLKEVANILGLDGAAGTQSFLEDLKHLNDLVSSGGKNINDFLDSLKSLVVNDQLNLLDEGTNASMVNKEFINERTKFVVALLSAFGMLPGVDNQRELESWFQSIMMSEDGSMQSPPPVIYSLANEKQIAGQGSLVSSGGQSSTNTQAGLLNRLVMFSGRSLHKGPFGGLLSYRHISQGIPISGTGFGGTAISNYGYFNQVPRDRVNVPSLSFFGGSALNMGGVIASGSQAVDGTTGKRGSTDQDVYEEDVFTGSGSLNDSGGEFEQLNSAALDISPNSSTGSIHDEIGAEELIDPTSLNDGYVSDFEDGDPEDDWSVNIRPLGFHSKVSSSAEGNSLELNSFIRSGPSTNSAATDPEISSLGSRSSTSSNKSSEGSIENRLGETEEAQKIKIERQKTAAVLEDLFKKKQELDYAKRKAAETILRKFKRRHAQETIRKEKESLAAETIQRTYGGYTGRVAAKNEIEARETAAINQLQAALSKEKPLEALLGLEFDEIQNEIEIASGLKSNLETALGITGADLVERTFGDIGGLAQNKIAEQKEAAAINQLQAALSNQNSLEELAALTFDEIQKERLIPEELKESLAGTLGVEIDELADMKFGDIGGLAQSKIAEQTSKAFVSTKLNSRIRGSKARQEYEKKREAAANEKELETTLAENLEWMAGVKKDAAIKMAGKAEELATKALKEADGALGSVELPPQLMDVQTKLDEAQSKLKVAKAELEQINEYFKVDESINKSLQAIDQQLKDLENKKIEVYIKNKTQVALYKAKAASALRHATDPIIDAKSSDNLMSIEGIIASLKEVDANLTEAKQGFQPTNQEYKDIEQKMAEIKPLLNELEIKQAEKPAQISDPEAEDEGVKQPSVEGTATVDQDYLDASNFTDVSDAEFIAKLKHELPEIPSYLFAELGNDFESGFSEVLKREFTSMDDFIQQVIDCFDKAAYRGILDGSNQDKLAEKINEVLEQAKLNVFTKLLQEKGIDINYDVQTVADLLSQLKESEPQVHDDIMEMITPQPIEYPEDYETLTAKNFQALFGVKQTGDSVYLGIDFLSDQEFTYFNNAAQELYVSKKSIEEAEFHSKSMELLARFIKDNRGDELNFTDHPKLSRLFADLPEDKKEQLAIFNEFMKSEDLSIDPVNAFDRAQRVASDFEEKQKVLKDGMGISPDDIVALMNELGKGTKKDKVFDKIHNYIFTKPNPNGNYYFQDPVMKRFAYIIYKLDAYLVKKVIETPGKKKNIRKSSEYVNLVSHLLPEKLVYHTSGNYRPTAQVKELFNSVVRTILDYLNKTTGEDKVSIDRFLVEMKIFGSNQQIEEGGAFYETLSRLNTLTKEEDAYFVHYQVFKDSLEFNKSGFSLNLETTPDFPKSFNLESLPGDSTIQTARAQLETNFKFIETKFREAFVPSFGEIKFEDIMDLFQKNPLGDHIITEQTYAQMTDQVLSLLDEQSQMTFLSDFLYPAITMHIQLNKLKNFKDDQLLKDVLKEEELKHTRHPATSEQIKKLDSKSLQQLLYLSSNGFDINRRNRPSLLNSAQLDAFLSIKKAFDNNTTSLIKLDAGEGKTFLSTIASQLCDITSSPIIHIAPFAQDVTGWAPLPMTNDAIDFSKLENGQHYWVKQNDMMASLKEASDTHSLKNALIFCDEYDRYPDLNKKLDELGCRKRCNMSATDNIEEVNQKVLEAAEKFKILANKASEDPNIQRRLGLLAEISLNKDSFNTHLFNQTIDAITTELVDKESFLHKKLTRLKEKVPNLIARRQNKMDHEFVTRKMTIKEDDDSPAIDSMIDGAKSFKGKKIQFIFQGIEFSARKSGKPGKNELPISKIKSSCEKLYQKGQKDQEGQEVQKALPVYLHLCAPKGMNGFNEGHRITLQYDGTDWTEIDFDEFKKAPQEGTQLTLYDTFTKVGGDFDQFSNKVDYQAIQVAPDALSDESSEPLSKSLLYQECRRARDSSCAINLFMSKANKAKVDDMPEGLLPYTADIEKKSNERVLQARAQRKRIGAEIKLFNATLNQWLAEVQPEPASFKESLQTELKDYANEHVGQYSGSKAPTPVELQGKWNTIFKEKYDERKNKLNKECATKKIEDLKQSFLEIKREVLKSKKDELEKKSGAKETPKLKLKRGADPKEIVILKRIFKKLEWEEPFNIVDIKTRFEEISANLWQAITTREDPARVEFFKTQENIEVRNLNERQTKNKYNIKSLADNITFVLKKDDEFRHNYMGEKSDQQNKFIIGIIEVIKDMLKDDAYDQEHGFERGYQDLDNPKGGAANFNRDRMSRWESMFKKKVDDILSQIEASLLVTKESPAIQFKTEGVESYDYHRALRWKAITNEASPK